MTASKPPSVAALHTLVGQLDRSQWAPASAIRASQFRHLARLVAHCEAESPLFAARLHTAGLTTSDVATPAGLAALAPMARRAIQTAGSELFCRRVPLGHGDLMPRVTSGSTGEPILVMRTSVSALFANAFVMREMQWHGRDLAGRLCLVRAHIPKYARHDSWGPPASDFGPTGPLLTLPVTIDARQMAAWIRDFAPTLLVIYPTALQALARHCLNEQMTLPGLTQILTTSETLSPDTRATTEAAFGLSVVDCYSSEEFGCIASQCPVSGLYHVMAEGLLAEVLNERGEPCRAGEIGRVAITDVHNYATPLVRYLIGDLVEVAEPCICGRGLPTWARIVGRERNLIVMPDGTRRWPITGFLRCREVAPVRQWQFIQESTSTIELRLVVNRPLSRGEEDGLKTLFCNAIGHHFSMRLTYFEDHLPREQANKYAEFVCQVPFE